MESGLTGEDFKTIHSLPGASTGNSMKRYLTGIDWVVNSIDYASKAQSGIGNHSEVILELKNPPGYKSLDTLLNDFIKKFPLLHGYPSRAMNLSLTGRYCQLKRRCRCGCVQ